jgi:hypothetical protein
MIACMESITLPMPTNATSHGPIIEARNSTLSLKYDNESDSGTTAWVLMQFEDVLAYKVHQSICASADSLVPSNEVRCLQQSHWLSEVTRRWSEAVGWQDYQRRLGGAERFKHFQIYFDDVCTVQVIAASYKVVS